jgi:hypothetical protein
MLGELQSIVALFLSSQQAKFAEDHFCKGASIPQSCYLLYTGLAHSKNVTVRHVLNKNVTLQRLDKNADQLLFLLILNKTSGRFL